MAPKIFNETPPTMLALALSKFGKPDTYNTATVPTPRITDKNEVLIKVEAASVNPIDVKMASGYVLWIGEERRSYETKLLMA